MTKEKAAFATNSNLHALEFDIPVALVDMDGTLCDCAGAIARGFAELRGPHEDPREEGESDPPAHIAARRRLIMSVPAYGEPYGLDRHHIANLQKLCTPANSTRELDFELKPFNRGNSYTLKVFIVAGGSEPGSITLSSAEAVRFTEIPSLAEAIAKAASTYAVDIGPFEIRLPK